MTKTILLDVDDVLLAYNDTFLTHNGLRLEEGKSYTKFEDIDGINTQDVARMVQDFNNSDHFTNLPPVEGAKEGIKELLNMDLRICLLTACGTTPDIRFRRHVNLIDVFGKDVFDEVKMIDIGNEKRPFLQQYRHEKDILLWVDDSPRHYYHGVECGINSLLKETPFNKYCKDDADMVESWQCIVRRIKGEVSHDKVFLPRMV